MGDGGSFDNGTERLDEELLSEAVEDDGTSRRSLCFDGSVHRDVRAVNAALRSTMSRLLWGDR